MSDADAFDFINKHKEPRLDVPYYRDDKYRLEIPRNSLWRGKWIWVQRVSLDDCMNNLEGAKQVRIVDDGRKGTRLEIELQDIEGWFRVGRQENLLVRYKPSRMLFRFSYLTD